MLSKYQDENVETQRLEINNNENDHNRYSGHNWCIYPTFKCSICKNMLRFITIAINEFTFNFHNIFLRKK